ncbi:Wzz/FepE/Etk N-terminal domain-containing protein [Cognatishimia sp. F0-27]|uniref:GumC family protein n=1 Tax=Cognatishimia sp. F0-27 TaxID=2816855 RepID=UPI001D0C9F01|nr:Wzz/FepE/Etk N-terminal domain-containing protein [Cognatishimia sp. F0-27]MCC1491153.1 chain-length determining protein [Cognatishimia sp. F0-27]
MNQFQSIGEVLSALRRRIWVILLVTAIGCCISLYVALNSVKVYEATAVVQIEDASVPDQLAGAMATGSDSARRVRLIEQRLMSRDNLVKIMEKHDLFRENPAWTINERVFQMRQAARIEEIVSPTPTFTAAGNVPSGLRIMVQLSDPQKAADLANELMASVIAQSRNRSVSRVEGTLEFFETEERRVGEQISALEADIAEFKRQNADQLPAGVSDLRAQLSDLRDAELEIDREIVSLRADAQRLREDVLARQVALLSEQKALLGERILRIEDQIEGAPEVERALSALERQQTQLQEQYTVITRRKAEAQMGQILEDRQQTDRFEILETALVPEAPISRSRKRTAIMGGVASVMAGIAVAFVIELMNPALRSAAQVERALGLQPVVSIPAIKRKRRIGGRGLGIGVALIAGLAAGLWGVLQLAGEKSALGDLLARWLPRSGEAN